MKRSINLDLALGYLIKWREDLKCENGQHNWDGWSATCNGNVSQMEKSGDFSRHRICKNCGVQMPDSSSNGGVNNVTFQEWSEYYYGGFLKDGKERILEIGKIYDEIESKQKWYKIIYRGIKKLFTR